MNEQELRKQKENFLSSREQARMDAMQRVALQLIAGIDFSALMASSAEAQQAAIKRLTRLIERERLKGVNGHWGYDLNRHIALKQVLDRLRAMTGNVANPETGLSRTDAGFGCIKTKAWGIAHAKGHMRKASKPDGTARKTCSCQEIQASGNSRYGREMPVCCCG